VPVAFFGVVGYALVCAVALIGLQPSYLAARWPTALAALLAAGGWLFTLYLTAIELFVLHAICRWCVGSAVVITVIALIAVPNAMRRERGAGSRERSPTM
jgi:uncharacterized membrane protein